MPHIEHRVSITATAEEVWKIISAPARAPDWMPDIKERQLLGEETAGVGMRWRDSGLLRGKSYQTEYEVTAWEPPARLAYRQVHAGAGGYQWDESIVIHPQETGVLVTARLDYRMPDSLPGKLYDKFVFRKDFRITLENRLEALKELLETE